MKNLGSTLDKLQLFPIPLYHTKSPKESHGGESMEIEPNVTKLLPYMAKTHNNEWAWSHNYTL